MGTISVPAVLESAAKIKATWSAHPTLKFGDLNYATFDALYAKVTEAEATIDAQRHELQGLVDKRDDAAKELKELVTRALSGIRAAYGPDAPEYEQAGGKRRSEHATRRRKAPPAK